MMTYGEFIRRSLSLITIIIITIFLIAAIIELSGILLLVFTCWVLSVGLNEATLKLRRWGSSKMMAIVVTVLSVIVFFILVLFVVIPPFVNEARNLVEDLPDAVGSLVQEYDDFRDENPDIGQYLPEFTVEDYNSLFGIVDEAMTGDAEAGSNGQPAGSTNESDFETNLDAGANTDDSETGNFAINIDQILDTTLPVLGGIGSFLGNVIANLVLIVLITGYLLFDPLVYYRPIIAIVPKNREKRAVEIISKIQNAVVSWMGALSISIAFTATMVTFALGVILQIPNAIALGVIAGLGTFIPNVGYYIGLVPIIIFTAVTDPWKVIPAALIYWAINEFEGKVVAPNVIRQQLNIPAGVVLPFQLMAAAVFGFFGILLAVPMLAIFVILWQELYVYDTLDKRGHNPRLIETMDGDLILLDDADPMPKRTTRVQRALSVPRQRGCLSLFNRNSVQEEDS